MTGWSSSVHPAEPDDYNLALFARSSKIATALSYQTSANPGSSTCPLYCRTHRGEMRFDCAVDAQTIVESVAEVSSIHRFGVLATDPSTTSKTCKKL
jgi:hypothetical protein